MSAVIDAYWRAVVDSLQPRLLLWSLLPLALAGGAVMLLGWAGWAVAVAAVQAALLGWRPTSALLEALADAGPWQWLVGPALVGALALPVLVSLTLLLVATLTTPAIVQTVVARRFPTLQARHGASAWQRLGWGLACTAAALLALALSLPLWLVPPLVLVLPPLIWGWLICRVLAFDVLARHASAAERRFLLRRHRGWLLAMGVACGYLGTLPAMVGAGGAVAPPLAPWLALGAVALATWIFVFAALWFAHFALAALQQLRDAVAAPPLIEREVIA